MHIWEVSLGLLTLFNADTGSTDLGCVEGAMNTLPSHLATRSDNLMREGRDWCDRCD